METGGGAGPSEELGPLREILLGRCPNVEVGTWGDWFPSEGVSGLSSGVFISGEFLALLESLATPFFGECGGWETGGGSNGIGRLSVRSWVG